MGIEGKAIKKQKTIYEGEKKTKQKQTRRVSYQPAEECLVTKPDSVKSNDCENKASRETTYSGGNIDDSNNFHILLLLKPTQLQFGIDSRQQKSTKKVFQVCKPKIHTCKCFLGSISYFFLTRFQLKAYFSPYTVCNTKLKK